MSPVHASPQLPPQTPALPVARFRKVVEDNPRARNKLAGVHDQQAQSFGYNKPGELFVRPAQYIHHVEPLESELAVRVEYDLDEQDQEWIDALNAERRKEQLDTVTYEIFEVVIDRLEKEYFELMKHVPKPENALLSEDSTCSICDDGEGENSNVIVFCDGCNLAVHQDCYGVPYIPEGQWLCRKCTVSPESPVSCVLCPNEGGAFKQTPTGQWVHLLCAIWIPEVNVANMTFMEPIENVNRIPKNRLKLTCSICRLRGPCIQCDNKSCFAAFHVTCARQQKFLAPMKAMPGDDEAPPLRAFCEKHLPPDLADARLEALEAIEAMDVAPLTSSPSSRDRKGKAARAYAKSYNLGPPLVPWIVVEHILAYLTRVRVRKTREFVLQVCKYWSLKREARRGAPLLKRLHLEPWTTTAVDRNIGEEQRRMKLAVMTDVRTDLEKLRLATGMVKQREKGKKGEAILIYELLEKLIFPHEAALRRIFERVSGLDRLYFFRTTVSRDEAPDYFAVVSNPICWNDIDDRLDRHEYWDVHEFTNDINRVLDNAMLYNKKDTVYYKTAEKIKAQAASLLVSLNDLSLQQTVHPTFVGPSSSTERPITGNSNDILSGQAVHTPALGDLEPALDLLRLLCDKELIVDEPELQHELNGIPIESLLSFEKPVPKMVKRDPDNSPRAALLFSDEPSLIVEQVEPRSPSRQSDHLMQVLDRLSEPESLLEDRVPVTVSQPKPQPKSKGKKAPRSRKTRVEKNASSEADAIVDRYAETNKLEVHVADVESSVESAIGGMTHFDAKMDPDAGPERIEMSQPPESSSSSAVVESLIFEPATSTEVSPSARSSVKRKRGPPENTPIVIPDVVSNVDNRSSFAMFNQGWVLDAGTRRGGRQAPDSSASPLNKKPRKGDRTKSRLSVVATTVEENETLVAIVSTPTDITDTEVMQLIVDVSSKDEPTPHKQFADPLVVVDANPDGEPSHHEMQLAELVTDVSTPKIPEPVVVPPVEDLIFEHLDTVSTVVASEAVVVPVLPYSRPHDKKPHTSSSRRNIRVAPLKFEEGKTTLDHGTLVWAKLASYAWFPAIVHDEGDPIVPPNVLAKKPKSSATSGAHLVLFVDTVQWAWVQPQNLQMLGDDRDADEVILHKQRYKGNKEKNDVFAAYNSAIAQMAPEGYEPSIDEEHSHDRDGGLETSNNVTSVQSELLMGI